MLIEFTVGNFRSFQERTTFSMVAADIKAKDPTLDSRNIIETGTRLRLLKTAAIYGANASGKTNLLRALDFMRDFVMDSSRQGQATDPISVEPFLLTLDDRNKPSFFEVVFLSKGKQFRYGFEVTRKEVVAEWLYRTPNSRETNLFRRDGQEITVGASFKEGGRDIRTRTRPNALFLSVVAQFNGQIAMQVLTWFQAMQIRLGAMDIMYSAGAVFLTKDSTRAKTTTELIRKLDLGIDGIEVHETPFRIPSILRDPQPTESDGSGLWSQDAQRHLYGFINAIEGQTHPEVRTIHGVFNEQGQRVGSEHFMLDEHESEGTKKLFGLAGVLVTALERGLVVFLDEIDARLHPFITHAIIDLFHDPATNPYGAQLIFTTHDTHLLRHTTFRRDQIWFVEKEQRGASHLYSLVEFKVRNDASFDKDYIHGRFGAIPFIGDLASILESADAT